MTPPPASCWEANFDGLVGPTHNYAGLAHGNLASARNADQPSNPREAALQGLRKMRALHELGLPQGVLPPHERPHLPTLHALGFTGKDAQVLARVRRDAPGLLAAASSASAMWVANAATVSASADTADGKVHFTPANLCSHMHRALEPATTARILRAVFPDPDRFTHHDPLPATPHFGDEGAANHTRLCERYDATGLELYVYGRGGEGDPAPHQFAPRQTRAASRAVARLHGISDERAYFAQQDPAAIDAGVFHNDVIAVGNRHVLFHHARAFLDMDGLHAWIWERLPATRFVVVDEDEVPLTDAVHTYLFNSQLISIPGTADMRLIAAQECAEHAGVRACIERIVADGGNPIAQVQYFDLRQSMRNGGGPACLRLRVVLSEAERAAVNPACWLTEKTYATLSAWVERHYRDRIVLDDLADPSLLDASHRALDELSAILKLGSVYDFQRAGA